MLSRWAPNVFGFSRRKFSSVRGAPRFSETNSQPWSCHFVFAPFSLPRSACTDLNSCFTLSSACRLPEPRSVLVSRSASAATELRRITQLRKGGGAGSRGQVTCAGRTIDRTEGMDQRVGGRPASPRSCPLRLDVDDRGRDRSAPNPVVEEGETPAGQSRRACEQAAPCLRRGMPVSRDWERPSWEPGSFGRPFADPSQPISRGQKASR